MQVHIECHDLKLRSLRIVFPPLYVRSDNLGTLYGEDYPIRPPHAVMRYRNVVNNEY